LSRLFCKDFSILAFFLGVGVLVFGMFLALLISIFDGFFGAFSFGGSLSIRKIPSIH
jgi:hypothetical protein